MNWIFQVIAVISLLGGSALMYETKDNKENPMRTVGIVLLIIGIILFCYFLFNGF